MDNQYGFVINIQDCYGCKSCEVVCKSENQTPTGVSFRKVHEFSTDSPNTQSFISMSCNHCDEPKCLEACPVIAYKKRQDGIVVQDHDICIGCSACITACPYDAPQYNPVEKKVSKCDMCADLVDRGEEPKCVQMCPGKVLKFGKIIKLQEEYGDNIEVIEHTYNMPSHKITKPNIVIIPVSRN